MLRGYVCKKRKFALYMRVLRYVSPGRYYYFLGISHDCIHGKGCYFCWPTTKHLSLSPHRCVQRFLGGPKGWFSQRILVICMPITTPYSYLLRCAKSRGVSTHSSLLQVPDLHSRCIGIQPGVLGHAFCASYAIVTS